MNSLYNKKAIVNSIVYFKNLKMNNYYLKRKNKTIKNKKYKISKMIKLFNKIFSL